MGSFHEVKDLTSILSARSDWSPLGQGQWGEEGRLQGSPWKAGGAGKTQVPAWGLCWEPWGRPLSALVSGLGVRAPRFQAAVMSGGPSGLGGPDRAGARQC